MRTSRIAAVMVVICFIVSGASVVWGADKEKECKYKHDSTKKVVVVTEENGKFKKFKIDNQDPVDADYSGQVGSVYVNFGSPAGSQKLIEVEDGTCMFTGNGTCVTYYSGGAWHQRCW